MSPKTARKIEGEAESSWASLGATPGTVTLNVLGYREDDEWAALALEMDLRGYGATFHEALQDLADLVAMQISFAHLKGQPELIWKPAEPIWFERFADARRERLNALVQERDFSESPYDVASLRIPSASVLDRFRSEFDPVEV